MANAPKGNSDTTALLALHDQLKMRSNPTSFSAPSTGSGDADLSVDNEIMDVVAGTLESQSQLRLQVEQALERVRSDVYGICTLCGKRIPQIRLNTVPATETCVPCAEKR